MKILLKYIIAIFFFSSVITPIFGQFNIGDKQLRDSSENILSFRFENSNFIKDNEFYSKLTNSGMYIGFFAKPTLEYYFTKNTKVNAGVFLLKYSGLDNFTQAIPIFSVQQKITKHLDLVMGSIYGNHYHQLDEPIYSIDNYFTNNVEYGAQFLYHSKYFDSDLWLNWEKYIFVGDPYQEQFHMGWASTFKYDINSLSISLPIQLYTSHKGGTIDSCPDPVISIFNGVGGINFKYNFENNTSLSFEPSIYYYDVLTAPSSGPFAPKISNGEAYYFKLKFSSKYLDAFVGYWHARDFVAPRGEYLFQSISIKDPDYYQKYRKLIPLKVIFKYPINKYINLQLRTDDYYNVIDKVMDHSYSLFLIINQDFFISKIRKNT
jgi:hypothetical protein